MNAIEWTTAVAKELGDGWTAAEYGDQSYCRPMAYLNGPDGMQLFVGIGGYRKEGRVEITWSIDRELTTHASYGQDTRKEITVAESKTAKRAAGDITRRLLAELPGLLAELRKRKVDADDAEATRDRQITKLVNILGGQSLNDSDRYYRRPEVSFGSWESGGKVQVNSNSCELTLRLPWDQMISMAFAIAEIRGT